MTTQTNILYPFALSKINRAVHVEEAMKGHLYQCFGCSAPMVPRQGSKRQWHFAHKPPFDRCADPDKALHDTAKALIIQGLSDALDSQGEYHLGCLCAECDRAISRNVAITGASVEPEKSIVPGTRSDLVVNRPDRDPVIIEIVVTHDLEPETRDSYEKSKIPMLKVRPTWDTLAELRTAVIADDTLNIPQVRCAACKDAADRKRREEEEIQSQVDSMLKRLNERKRSASAKLPFRPWTHDRFDRPMFPRIRQKVYANAIILTELGFVQATNKPWLFLFRFPDSGVVFANFGSTDEVPIWEDMAAFIHWKLDRYSEEVKSVLVEGVLARCRAAGADVRVSFYNLGFDQWEDPSDTDPIGNVDRVILNKLLTEADQISARHKACVLALRDQDYSLSVIARKLGITEKAICDLLKHPEIGRAAEKNGDLIDTKTGEILVDGYKKGYREGNVEPVLRLRSQGCKSYDIAGQLKISQKEVEFVLQRHGHKVVRKHY